MRPSASTLPFTLAFNKFPTLLEISGRLSATMYGTSWKREELDGWCCQNLHEPVCWYHRLCKQALSHEPLHFQEQCSLSVRRKSLCSAGILCWKLGSALLFQWILGSVSTEQTVCNATETCTEKIHNSANCEVVPEKSETLTELLAPFHKKEAA